MKRLTLMRHGNAEWKDAEIADFERPLTRRGTSEAEAMARRLGELGLVPTLLVTSTARRAQTTAEIVARELGILSRRLRSEEALYLATASDVLQLLKATGPRIPHLMIIGHNPGLSEVGRQLGPALGDLDLSTGAMCSMTFETRAWTGIDASTLRDSQHEAPSVGLFRMFA